MKATPRSQFFGYAGHRNSQFASSWLSGRRKSAEMQRWATPKVIHIHLSERCKCAAPSEIRTVALKNRPWSA
jgi:hypothetical protein